MLSAIGRRFRRSSAFDAHLTSVGLPLVFSPSIKRSTRLLLFTRCSTPRSRRKATRSALRPQPRSLAWRSVRPDADSPLSYRGDSVATTSGVSCVCGAGPLGLDGRRRRGEAGVDASTWAVDSRSRIPVIQSHAGLRTLLSISARSTKVTKGARARDDGVTASCWTCEACLASLTRWARPVALRYL